MLKNSILLSLSGGLDSTTLLAHSIAKGGSPLCVSFYYGSKHNPYENRATVKIAKYYKVQLIHIDISPIMKEFKSNLLKSGPDIPEGHYNDSRMSQTVVPARNLIFLSILSGMANSLMIPAIGIAVHQGDHFIYPDCRPDFIFSAEKTIQFATDGEVNSIYCPFLNMSKIDIVRIGRELAAPYQLTRTCYKDQEIACGKCGACVERLEAFEQNNIIDPIQYMEK